MTDGVRKRAARHNKQVIAAEEKYASQLRLAAASERERAFNLEREKVLCDQVLHQNFFCQLMGGSNGAFSTPATGAPGVSHPAHWHQQQQEAQQLQQQQAVPNSYVAQLLRKSTHQQVQQVLNMRMQDWLHYFAHLFPKLVVLIEMCERACYADSSAAAAALAGDTDAACAADPSSSSDIMAQWFGRQQPLGFVAAADCERLQETVDSTATLVMLAYIFNHLPLLEACACSYSPGPQLRPGPQHWRAVSDRLKLTHMQELHMSICLAEYRRLNQSSRAAGGSLVECAAVPNLLIAAAQQQQQQQQQQHSESTQEPLTPLLGAATSPDPAMRMHRSSMAGASASEDSLQSAQDMQDCQEESDLQELGGGQDQLQDQLQQYVQRRHVHLLSAATFFMNTLNVYQLAVLISASYPFLPSFSAVAEVVSVRVQQRQQQELQQSVGAMLVAQGLEANHEQGGGAADCQGVDGKRGGRGRSHAAMSPEPPLNSGGVATNGSSAQGTSRDMTYLQTMLELHQQKRAQELEFHRQICWSELQTMS